VTGRRTDAFVLPGRTAAFQRLHPPSTVLQVPGRVPPAPEIF